MSDQERRDRVVEGVRAKLAAVRGSVRPAPEPRAPDPAAAKRAEIRRLHRELFPPVVATAPLSLDEQLEALRGAVQAKRVDPSRPSTSLVEAAIGFVKAKRPPREH